jgi:hypothetical protein
MAYTQVAPVTPTVAGAVATWAAPAGVGAGNGDAIPDGAFLLVNNASASPITLTLNVAINYEGLTITSPTVTVPATTIMAIGPFNQDPFGQLSGADKGYVHVDYSSITTVTRMVLKDH